MRPSYRSRSSDGASAERSLLAGRSPLESPSRRLGENSGAREAHFLGLPQRAPVIPLRGAPDSRRPFGRSARVVAPKLPSRNSKCHRAGKRLVWPRGHFGYSGESYFPVTSEELLEGEIPPDESPRPPPPPPPPPPSSAVRSSRT
ncbi:hypothetical protein KM043_012332 [Ampulex compressa]|nr:hypothetical protein KM043_012332 [Ampulex compressa]